MNAYPDARWVGLRFTFEFIDQEARLDAAPTSSSQAPGSQLKNVLDTRTQQDAAYIHLEHNRWGLNSNLKPLPSDYTKHQTGWIGSLLSKADCTFSVNPFMEFAFTDPHSSIGFTIHFDPHTGQHATKLLVQTFDSVGRLLGVKYIENHSANCIINMLSPDYSRVRFTFQETSRPYSRVRIAEILFGIIETYEPKDIVTASLEYAVDPVADTLPSRQTVFRIDNSDQRFNLINPNGIYAYLQQPQAFQVSLGIGDSQDAIEYVSMGEFFFATASAEDSSLTAEITAYDWFFWLEKGKFSVAETGTWTLHEAVASILASAGVSCPVILDPSVADTPLIKVTEEMTNRKRSNMSTLQKKRTAAWIL